MTQCQEQSCSHTKSTMKFHAGSNNQTGDACFIQNAPAEHGAGDPVLLWLGGKSRVCGQGELRERGRSTANHDSRFTFLLGRERQRQPSAPWKKVSACSSHRAVQLAEDSSWLSGSSGRGLRAALMPQSVVGVSLGASENPLRSQERPLWCESREQIRVRRFAEAHCCVGSLGQQLGELFGAPCRAVLLSPSSCFGNAAPRCCTQSPGLPRPGTPLCEISAAAKVRARVVPEDVF